MKRQYKRFELDRIEPKKIDWILMNWIEKKKQKKPELESNQIN